MNTAITRSFVLGGSDRIAPLQEQWHDRVRQRFHRGPDPQQAAIDVIVERRPNSVLEVGAGSGQFAAQLRDRLDGSVVITDPSAMRVEQADMRDITAVVARATALPLASATFDCVVVRRPPWRDHEVGPALGELIRVLDQSGALVLSVGSPRADGHELDDLLGRTLRRRRVGLTTDTAHETLVSHFRHVEQRKLDHAMVFSTGSDLAAYLEALPARRALADQVRDRAGPFRLTYDVRLFVATVPRERPTTT